MSSDDKNETRKDKPSSHHHTKNLSYFKCGSCRLRSYLSPGLEAGIQKTKKSTKVIKDQKVGVLKPMRTDFTSTMNFKNYRLEEQSEEYNSNISGKIGKPAKSMDVQMRTAVFNRTVPVLVLSILRNYKSACYRSRIYKHWLNVVVPTFHSGALQSCFETPNNI